MPHQNSRRDFLKTSAVIGAGYFISNKALADEPSSSPNAKVNFGCIGVDGRGRNDTAEAAANGHVAAICDVDERKLEAAAKVYPDAKKFTDFRALIDEMGDKIDAVTISTPDHTHATAAAQAMRAGKHCFCQKPLTHTIYEARFLADLAREKGVATQMGNQGTSFVGARRSASQVKAGAAGKIKEVHVWTNRPVWRQGQPLSAEIPVPPTLHWDLWLGPAPAQPFTAEFHPFAWRGWWSFGTGALGDMACHTLNMPFMALDLRNPIAVQAETSGHDKVGFPARSKITYEYADGSKIFWYDGSNLPDKELFHGHEIVSGGALLVGEKGSIYARGDYGEKPLEFLNGAEEVQGVDFERSPGHFQELVRAINGGQAATSNFPDYSGPMTELVLLGNLAVWADGKRVEWDAKNMIAKNAPECAHLISREYREGWTL